MFSINDKVRFLLFKHGLFNRQLLKLDFTTLYLAENSIHGCLNEKINIAKKC
jgi:hypothetical protein